mmetsp:Transcript_29698/g.78957  ORF Transcript_29698/g.78957 Transcript_29698/m.78957 type:complete len:191 (+) Transcript_29698:578-1150(+)
MSKELRNFSCPDLVRTKIELVTVLRRMTDENQHRWNCLGPALNGCRIFLCVRQVFYACVHLERAGVSARFVCLIDSIIYCRELIALPDPLFPTKCPHYDADVQKLLGLQLRRLRRGDPWELCSHLTQQISMSTCISRQIECILNFGLWWLAFACTLPQDVSEPSFMASSDRTWQRSLNLTQGSLNLLGLP